jgi:hypothetical protein
MWIKSLLCGQYRGTVRSMNSCNRDTSNRTVNWWYDAAFFFAVPTVADACVIVSLSVNSTDDDDDDVDIVDLLRAIIDKGIAIVIVERRQALIIYNHSNRIWKKCTLTTRTVYPRGHLLANSYCDWKKMYRWWAPKPCSHDARKTEQVLSVHVMSFKLQRLHGDLICWLLTCIRVWKQQTSLVNVSSPGRTIINHQLPITRCNKLRKSFFDQWLLKSSTILTYYLLPINTFHFIRDHQMFPVALGTIVGLAYWDHA